MTKKMTKDEEDAGLAAQGLNREKISMMSGPQAQAEANRIRQSNFDMSAAPLPTKKGFFGGDVTDEAQVRKDLDSKEQNSKVIGLLLRQVEAMEKVEKNSRKGPKGKTKSKTTLGNK